MATTKTRKKTRKSPKKSAKKSAKKPAAKKTAKRRAPKAAAKKTRKSPKKAAKKSAKKSGLERMKRGSGYGSINTLTLTTAQATQLGKLMRSHRCSGKGKRTVCMTKGNRVVAVIEPNA